MRVNFGTCDDLTCSRPDLSPVSSRDAHMVLVLDLLKTEQHGTLTAKVIEHYGHVRLSSTTAPTYPVSQSPNLSVSHSHNHFLLNECAFQIDVLINNAGSSQRAIALDTELEVDKVIVELNTIGTVSLTKSVLPHMIERHSGSLVVISSVAGIIGKLA